MPRKQNKLSDRNNCFYPGQRQASRIIYQNKLIHEKIIFFNDFNLKSQGGSSVLKNQHANMQRASVNSKVPVFHSPPNAGVQILTKQYWLTQLLACFLLV